MRIRVALPLATAAAAMVLAGCTGDSGQASSQSNADQSGGAERVAQAGGTQLADVEGPVLADDAITVQAVGSVKGAPDVLTAHVGVRTRADSVQAAYDQAGEAATAVRDALLGAGVQESDLETAQLSVRSADPDHPHEPPEPEEPEPEQERGETGPAATYVAQTTLRVTLRDVDAAGATIDEAVAAAGDAARLRSLSFSLQEDSELVRQARQAAFERARAKAKQYAELADRSLGELVGVAEAEGPQRPHIETGLEHGGPPIEPGTEDVTVELRAKWALD